LDEEIEMRIKFGIATMLALLASTQGAFAQSCALCYASASALGQNAQRSLDIGILTLLTPALVLFAAVVFMLYRRATSAAV
jgi:hypothetical protein